MCRRSAVGFPLRFPPASSRRVRVRQTPTGPTRSSDLRSQLLVPGGRITLAEERTTDLSSPSRSTCRAELAQTWAASEHLAATAFEDPHFTTSICLWRRAYLWDIANPEAN